MTQLVRAGIAAVAALVVLFSSTGCESLLAPISDERTYVLESVGGVSLPALVFASETNRVTMLADTVRLQRDGSGTKVYAIDVEYLKEPNRNGRALIERRISYMLKGDAVAITDICGPAELCAPSPHWTGRISSSELRLNGAPGPSIYRRVHR
jgi:hypothetical protein